MPLTNGLEKKTIASFDGTPIGVQMMGPADAPVLLLANGAGATIAAYRFVIERFPRAFRFVSWDYRGLYSSARPVRGYDGLRVEDHAKDALAVLESVGAREFHALGWSMGVQVLLELYRSQGDRFETLVLHNGAPGKTWETFGAPAALRRALEPLLRLGQRADGFLEATIARAVDWPAFIPVAIRTGFVHHDVDRAVFAEVARGFKDIDMHLYVELLRNLGRHDATDVLGKVECPTLIVHGTEDRMTPLAVAERMARDIPGARLALLPSGTHYAAVEMPSLMNEHLEEFWRIAGLDV